MKNIDDFNRLEEQAWRHEKMLLQKYGLKEPDKDETDGDRERCRKCLSGEMPVFCEVCTCDE
jgi:hypothetical protein